MKYLIVGQGLAGTAMHYALWKKGIKAMIIDNSHHNSSSMVAAGLYNPIVFKRLNKSWNADLLIPAMENFYASLENFLEIKILHKMPIKKIFTSQEEENMWVERMDNPAFDKYLKIDFKSKSIYESIHSELGFGEVRNGGWLDLELLLSTYKKFLESHQLIVNDKVDYNLFEFVDDRVIYKGDMYDNVIFCEGYQAKNNPFFNHLPLNTTKGELLHVDFKDLPIDSVLNKGFFILPHNNHYRVGATYQWNDDELSLSDEARVELTNKIKSVTDSDFEVIKQLVGIRPTVKDRRPLIGKQSKFNNLFIFNGLGTKGVMIAPFYANQFADCIVDEKSLDNEININRFELF